MLNFKIVGLDKLNKKLGEGIKKPLISGIKKIVFTLEGETKVATPVGLSGDLSSSEFSKYGATEGMVGTNKEYAPFVEYGTQYMEARHVTRNNQTRVLGQGMFSFGLEQLKKKMGNLLKGIAINIENRWGS